MNFLSDFLPIAAGVWPSPKRTLVHDNPYCVVVASEGMILVKKHFWCHVPWRATRISSVIAPAETSNAEVRHFYVARLCKYKVLRLDIAMDNVAPVNVLKCLDQASNPEPSYIL